MKLKPVAVLLGALVVLAWCLCSPGVLAGQTAAEQVVLVLWHGLTMEDAAILRLQGPVALGLLNTRAGEETACQQPTSVSAREPGLWAGEGQRPSSPGRWQSTSIGATQD